MKARHLWLLAAILLVTGCHDDGVMTPTQPATVQLVSERSDYRVGDQVILRVVVRDADNVGSAPFHLRFDPDVLQFTRATEGDFMGSDGATVVFLAAESGAGGEVVIGLSRLGSLQGMSGDGTLVEFRFEALATGPCNLEFSGASLKDPQASNLMATFNSVALNILP